MSNHGVGTSITYLTGKIIIILELRLGGVRYEITTSMKLCDWRREEGEWEEGGKKNERTISNLLVIPFKQV